MPPALEAIVTLNITSTATLDLLLSALLTNTTAGVNGTFQTVRNQVASLGLAGPILSALASAPVISQGLYGPPTYNKAPPSAGGIWGDFWNAVSAVVTTITGAIVSIVGEVWSVGVAAATYLNQIASEAAALGGLVLARVAGTLVAVGKAMLNVLNVLLEYISSLVKAALAVVVNSIMSGVSSYSSSVVSATLAAYDDSKVTSADTIRFGNALSGSVFELGLGLGAAAAIVLTIAMPLDLGPAFLVGIILGLLTTAVAAELAPQISGVTSFSAAAVHAIEGWVNTTNANTTVKNTRQWGTAAGIIGLVGGLSDSPVALGMLYAELFPPDELQGNPLTAIVVLALDAAVIGLGLYLLAHNNVPTAVVALALAFMALTATAYHFLTSEIVDEVPSLRFLGEIDLGISAAGTALIAADLLIIL